MEARQQIERAIRKVADKFPAGQEPVLTDIHVQVIPGSGEIRIYNDDDQELHRCVVEEWIDSPDAFYDEAAEQICQCLASLRESVIDKMAVMQPFSFVLVDEDHETLRDLYLVDDDTLVLSGPLLEGLDEELDAFLRDLMVD
ncbi:MAG: hypothetical protein HUK02_02920 [Bacteroidaceae bacterium]|nr:hypothetical protein [Bacteroidaceae bacterium]